MKMSDVERAAYLGAAIVDLEALKQRCANVPKGRLQICALDATDTMHDVVEIERTYAPKLIDEVLRDMREELRKLGVEE